MAQNTKNKKQVAAKKAVKQQITWAPGMPFGMLNYILLVAGLVVLGIGYVLLSGGGTDNPNEFSEAIFDTRRLTVAPFVLVIGFAIEFVAIFLKIANKEENPAEQQQ
ncbi:MAG: DUF3098 domain-containing protein [Lentimicrobiaceae bacterium]|nr:DUF3098 domain-containing protein [Lentimicrobiaceae bacterium]